MLAFENLRQEFGSRVVLKDLTMRLPLKQRLALIGANGAGKSTLLDIITGHLPPTAGRVLMAQGTVLGYLPQIPNPKPKASILEECLSGNQQISMAQTTMQIQLEKLQAPHSDTDEAVISHAYSEAEHQYRQLGGYELPAQASTILHGLGFSDDQLSRAPTSLSGGWRMRLELAKIFINNPNVLLLDEPTNHLDLPSLAWVEDYLANYTGTLIFVSHDRPLLNRLATGILELKAGNLSYYPGNFDAYLEARELRAEELQARMSQLNQQQKHLQGFIDRFGAKASKARQAQSRVKMLDRLNALEQDLLEQDDSASGPSMRLRLPEVPSSARQVLTVKDLDIGYGTNALCRQINMEVEKGSRVAIIGANGIGKSTLIKTLISETPALGGIFKWGDRVALGYFAQDQERFVDPNATVLDMLSSVGIGQPEARSLLGSMLFSGDDVYKKVGVLSGGERHRLGLCRLFASRANTVILDEPTNHLDMLSVTRLIAALQEFTGTLIFVSHDRDFIDDLCTHILVMLGDGRSALFHGKIADYQRLAANTGFPDILQAHLQSQIPGAKPEQVKQNSAKTETGSASLSKNEQQAARKKAEQKQKQSEALLKKIENHKAKLELIETEMSQLPPTDFQGLNRLNDDASNLREQITKLEDEWLSLEEA